MKPKVKSKPGPEKVGTSSVLMPLVPDALGIHPLLAALLSCAAFLDLSDENVVSPAPAGKVLEQIGAYVHRLTDEELDELAVDLETLEEHAKAQGFSQEIVAFIHDFLANCGFAVEDEADDASDDGDASDDDDGDDDAPESS